MTSEAVEAPEGGDRALLERLRGGEDAAFGELFSRHSAAVFRLALGLVNDRAEADDLTAEAFFRVLQAIRRGAGPVDNVRGYLLIVARRVAWEWSLRRKEMPVSDEELTHRAPANPDTSGQFTERNLIRRAFTSLPERWRRVLWKMEVEGERPAAVATNFGLSPNATAALARRARQGLRAAYLQAHLASERSAVGCRSVLEKLGAYTAGTTSGIERRRIRTHLSTCTSCTAMYAELRDIFVGLRPHTALATVPVVGAALWQLGATLKGLLASTKVQVGIAATSAAAAGALGFAFAPWGGGDDSKPMELAGKRAIETHAAAQPVQPRTTVDVRRGSLEDSITPPEKDETSDRGYGAEDTDAPVTPTSGTPAGVPAEGAETTTTEGDGRDDVPMSSETPAFDESAPIVYRETTVETYSHEYEDYTLVQETTTVTEVNSLDQTRTTKSTTTYTQPKDGHATAMSATDPAPTT
ncbi:sigma-70 family RNA polymerase sigma factor [Actinophytocola algeriensis]|uniref:RNA polymerase sigma factor (Sigma-70 family) n=1 Tax=Actinophytocola algeriensis TaxID=1768010 RepID=A0A7W7Q4A4_9PSEU|nr:sigma-70 family RNA polymerase sigma factor [Actinophytocola algeriensis]MBB4906801.1 RNA polymerase sigma factor (sigma-70 family) [Actinophytocola algeriensis]MBE1478282.1 RNA polymerase sigma factor (sigma-70 family) [Actinophytocola algeriensis]